MQSQVVALDVPQRQRLDVGGRVGRQETVGDGVVEADDERLERVGEGLGRPFPRLDELDEPLAQLRGAQ